MTYKISSYKIYGILLATLIGIILLLVNWAYFQKLISSPKKCYSGLIWNMATDEFIKSDKLSSKNTFQEYLAGAIGNARKIKNDYFITSFRLKKSTLAAHSPNYSFYSKSENKFINTIGEGIISESKNFENNKQPIINDNLLPNLLSLDQAVEIAKPILSCFPDFPTNIETEIYLYIDPKTYQKLIKISVSSFRTLSDQNQSVNHFVTIDAFTGSVVEYR